jgi:hypothetical protein
VTKSARFLPLVPAVTILLAMTACGGDKTTPDSPNAQPTTPGTPPAATTQATVLDAKGVLDRLKAAQLPLSAIAVQDENTDPNGKLGRPGGYTSRASADVPGGDKNGDKYGIDRGLVVEVFTSTEDADARSKFIQDTLKAAQILGTEYHYRPADKRILVRLTGKVKPSEAKKFEQAVAAL